MTKPLHKPRLRPVIRVFVSSTFSDMKHERNALQADVFPKLEQLCLMNGFQFQAIDLRWGVSSEAALDHRTMRICFDELRRAQKISPKPNFLILLGNRYGWRPLPEEISVEEFNKLECAAAQIVTTGNKPPAATVLREWYRKDENAIPAVYVLQSRRQRLPDSKDYTEDTLWNEVQAVLWAIINDTMLPEQLQYRFDNALLADGSPPAIVRFQASATEQEIWHGALRVSDAWDHVLAFFRKIENASDFFDAAQIKDFVDLTPSGSIDPALTEEQERLKKALEPRLGERNVFTNSARLVPTRDSQGRSTTDVTTNHIAQLCTDVESRLTQIIQEQIEEYWDKTAQASTERASRELKIEQAEHERFGRERGGEDSFVGRQTELEEILNYVRNESPWPLVIYGASGCGKTALLAQTAGKVQQEKIGVKNADVIVRFIGATPSSSDVRSLLGSLCQELRLQHPRAGELPTDTNALKDELYEQLQSATAEQPLILFLDALDQLSDADGGRLLNWIPMGQLPPHVKLVVSCLSDRAEGDPAGQPFVELKQRQLPAEINLDVLSECEARTLLFDRWLHQEGRTVSPVQREHIEQRLASTTCRQPIYLKLLFEEARLWRSYDPAPDLGKDAPALLVQLFERLSQPANHGRLLVERVLGYLAASRYGLAENEILEILFTDPEYRAMLDHVSEKTCHELPPNAKRIPIAIWSRLRFDLAPYLTERAAAGANVLTFYHRQLAECVYDRFGQESAKRWQPDRFLSDYFFHRADPSDDGSYRGDGRALREMPYHLVHSGLCDKAIEILTDLRYLDARCASGYVTTLLDDFSLIDNTNDARLKSFRVFLVLHAQHLTTFPEAFFSLVQLEGPSLARVAATQLIEKGLWKKPWLRTEPVLLPSYVKSSERYSSIKVLYQFLFDRSYAVVLACKSRIVFRLKRLGEIALVDLNRLVELPPIIAVRKIRPLALFVSEDANNLAIAYENGEVDIVQLHWLGTGQLTSQSCTTTQRYHVPESETPVMAWSNEGLWYQQDEKHLVCHSNDSLTRIQQYELPLSAQGELAGIVFSGKSLVVSIRMVSSGAVVCLNSPGDNQVVVRQRVQVDQLCACEQSNVAVAWSDRRLCLYDSSRGLIQLSETTLDETVLRMACHHDSILWAAHSGGLHAFRLADNANKQTRLMGDEAIYAAGHLIRTGQLSVLADGSIATVTDVGVTCFNLAFAEAPPHPSIYAVFQYTEGRALAIQKNNDGAWAVTIPDLRKTHLTNEQDIGLRPSCDFNGRFLLLSLHGSNSVRFDLETQQVDSLPRLPLAICSVAGDPKGGFWLADRMGGIFRMEDNGSCNQAATVNLRGVSGPTLLCAGNILIWAGTCYSHQESGEDMAHAMEFYHLISGRLELLGKRVFKKHEGHIEAFDYNSELDQLSIAIQKTSGTPRAFLTGRIDQFIRSTEELIPYSAFSNRVLRIRHSADGKNIHVLTTDGALIALNKLHMNIEAVLTPTVPFTELARGFNAVSHALVIAGETKLLNYKLERPL